MSQELPVTPRQKRQVRTRQAILDAASAIIAEKGVEGLSMREIASRSEYSPSGLYEYFASKNEIVDALVEEGFTKLSAMLRRVSQNASPDLRLIDYGLLYLEFALAHPEQYLLMFNCVPTMPTTAKPFHEYEAYQQLEQAVQAGIESGYIRTRANYGLNEITFQCWSMVHGIAMLRQTLFKDAGDDFSQFNRYVIEGAILTLCSR